MLPALMPKRTKMLEVVSEEEEAGLPASSLEKAAPPRPYLPIIPPPPVASPRIRRIGFRTAEVRSFLLDFVACLALLIEG
jgi:hypothetical protein